MHSAGCYLHSPLAGESLGTPSVSQQHAWESPLHRGLRMVALMSWVRARSNPTISSARCRQPMDTCASPRPFPTALRRRRAAAAAAASPERLRGCAPRPTTRLLRPALEPILPAGAFSASSCVSSTVEYAVPRVRNGQAVVSSMAEALARLTPTNGCCSRRKEEC